MVKLVIRLSSNSLKILYRCFNELDDSLITNLTNSAYFDTDQNPIIHLHLSTDGGEYFSAISVIETIKKLKCDVHVYVEGLVASAGTLVMCVCAKRMMGPYSKMLVHQLRGGHTGTYTDMEDNMENCQSMMSDIKSIYMDHTDFPEDSLDNLLKREKYLSAERCLEYGLVDVITP